MPLIGADFKSIPMSRTIMTDEYFYTNQCVHGSMPPCSSACPFNLDIRAFIKKAKSGNFNAAYRLLTDAVLFPAIVSKLCEEKCSRACPKNLDLQKIERACIRYATRRDPNNYAIPPKNKPVAVIGAGLCGLACALRLAAKRYDVTVFESADRIGGSLKDVMDERMCLDEFALQFKYVPYKLFLNQKIESVAELEDYEAVFIATGRDGADFGLLEGWDGKSMATVRDGAFLGGERAGQSKTEALAAGIVAAASIEKYLQTKSMSGQPETFIEHESLFSVDHIERGETIVPRNGGDYDAEEAVAESKRCAMCDCTTCMERCEFLKWMGLYPPEIETRTIGARNTMQGLIERQGSRMIFSCSLCGQCGSVCPKGVSLEGLLAECKKMLFDSRKYPEALHDYYMRDMADAMGPSYLARTAPGCETAGYLLFPGCQVTESGAQYVKEAYSYLRGIRRDTAVMLGCCGVPALWAGDRTLLARTLDRIRNDWSKMGKPIAVTLCATCMKTFKEYLPEMTCISLYEFMAENGAPQTAAAVQSDWAVFDPCASRSFPAMQQAVRKLAQMKGARLTELPDAGETARCCGMGGHIYPANRSLALNMVKHAADLSDKPYIAYCTNCRNLFLSAGKPCKHVLDDVFGLEPLAKLFPVSQLKKNRKALKEDLLKDLWGEAAMTGREEKNIHLCISESVLDKMNNLLISEEDVAGVIRHCEETGSKLIREDSGTFIAYRQIGIITYWVEFSLEKSSGEDVYKVLNVYSHRLMIVGP